MYPRILYAFSDVVVFVLDNPKTLEVVVERLLEWADANYSKSINQPVKPHAVIALNKSSTKTPDDQWNTVNATANLLSTANAKIDENQTFVKYAQKWRKASLSRIDSMHDLLRCYYSTVHVVRLPEKSRYQLLDQQRQQLHQVIQNCCSISHHDKKDRELLTDVDEFGQYLSLAFDHFSDTLDEPFDFVEASLKRNPLSESFSDNILLFVRRFAVYKSCQGQISALFKRLTPFIASCVLLESARKQRVGRPDDWFGDFEDDTDSDERSRSRGHGRRASSNPKAAKQGTYREMCRRAIYQYMKWDVPCVYMIRDLNLLANGQRQCDLRQAYHENTHRAKTKLRTIDAQGKFETNVEDEMLLEWEQQVLAQLIHLHDKSKRLSAIEYRQSVAAEHVHLIQELYGSGSGGADGTDTGQGFKHNSLCVTCISNPPQHTIECGHIICTECAKDFGQSQGRTITIHGCPICSNRHHHQNAAATIIHLSPPCSGLRVLCLDGGGIRGIVELSVLRAIERCVGVDINKCFDLVVGASTGGIIALGLGHHMWTVEDCTKQFTALVPQAFTKRKGQDVHIVRRIQLFVKHSKYETTPLEMSLKRAFGEKTALFPPPSGSSRLKTTVVAVSSSGTTAWALSNYNTSIRVGADAPSFWRYRPERGQDELYSWEAARSTSAAPGFFKPFSPLRVGRQMHEWIDGAVLHNNPIEIALEETLRIAHTENLNPVPDVVLSVGTGLSNRLRQDGEFTSKDSRKAPPAAKTTGLIRNLFTMVSYQIKLNTDADRRWQRAVSTHKHLEGNLHRINPDLGRDPPELDTVHQVSELATLVPKLLDREPDIAMKIKEVSAALVASLFFFERDGMPISTTSTSTELCGWICCGLRGDKQDIENLGSFLWQSPSPEFIIYNEPMNIDDVFVPVPVDVMVRENSFPKIRVKIVISGDDVLTTIALRLPKICGNRNEFPISGFPRKLMRMDFRANMPSPSLSLASELGDGQAFEKE